MSLPLIKLDRVSTPTGNLGAETVRQEGADAVGGCAYSLTRTGPIATHDDYSVRRIRVEKRNGILPADAPVYFTKYR